MCKECLLYNKDVEYSEGDEVGIRLNKGRALNENKYSFSYNDGEKEVIVGKYAYPINVVIIKKNS